MKKTYIHPATETMVLPKDALMQDVIVPASGGSFPGGMPANPAPLRAPVLMTDTVRVF